MSVNPKGLNQTEAEFRLLLWQADFSRASHSYRSCVDHRERTIIASRLHNAAHLRFIARLAFGSLGGWRRLHKNETAYRLEEEFRLIPKKMMAGVFETLEITKGRRKRAEDFLRIRRQRYRVLFSGQH
jgi:hypothetical protein